jgi:hypothetical protein
LAVWVPVGIDGGMTAVVVLDVVLTWISAPVAWLQHLVRVFVGGLGDSERGGGLAWLRLVCMWRRR